jgi:hypothetical protein
MTDRLTVYAAAMVAVVVLAGIPAAGQTKGKQAKGQPYDPPRLDGKPDLNGMWQGPAGINNDLSGAKLNGKNVIVDPADGKIPYLPAALAKQKQNNQNRAKDDPVNKCYMPGVPRLMYMPDPFMIVHTPDFVAILSQYMHNVRNIPVDGSKHLEAIDLWMGDSRGSWDGDTFVVDTVDFNDMTWFDAAGNYHSDALHVVERFTRTSPATITYEATLEDPNVFSKPWKVSFPLTQKTGQLLENECHYRLEGPTVTEGTKPDPHREKK